jgi:hypothetical protein
MAHLPSSPRSTLARSVRGRCAAGGSSIEVVRFVVRVVRVVRIVRIVRVAASTAGPGPAPARAGAGRVVITPG